MQGGSRLHVEHISGDVARKTWMVARDEKTFTVHSLTEFNRGQQDSS